MTMIIWSWEEMKLSFQLPIRKNYILQKIKQLDSPFHAYFQVIKILSRYSLKKCKKFILSMLMKNLKNCQFSQLGLDIISESQWASLMWKTTNIWEVWQQCKTWCLLNPKQHQMIPFQAYTATTNSKVNFSEYTLHTGMLISLYNSHFLFSQPLMNLCSESMRHAQLFVAKKMLSSRLFSLLIKLKNQDIFSLWRIN